jgi:hypothetical protein
MFGGCARLFGADWAIRSNFFYRYLSMLQVNSLLRTHQRRTNEFANTNSLYNDVLRRGAGTVFSLLSEYSLFSSFYINIMRPRNCQRQSRGLILSCRSARDCSGKPGFLSVLCTGKKCAQIPNRSKITNGFWEILLCHKLFEPFRSFYFGVNREFIIVPCPNSSGSAFSENRSECLVSMQRCYAQYKFYIRFL